MLLARFSVVALVAMLIAAPAAKGAEPEKPDAAAAEDAQTGAFHLTTTERSPQSPIREMAVRCGWAYEQIQKSNFEKDYDIAKESFEAWVPEAYKPDDGWGLLVWINAGENGAVNRRWTDLLIKHKLLWVGANGAGNPRAMWCRAGLALDAAHAMKQRYKIDPSRVYVAGFSGGGRMSSMVGVAYPDVFAGGMYMGGCNFYRDMPVPMTAEQRQAKEPQQYWRGTYKPPPLKFLTDAKKKSRHVLVTGENDPNRAQAKFNYQQGFKKDGFLNVLDIEVPEIGHQMPSNEWVEKALAFLDERPAPATRPATKPVVAPRR